MKTVGITPAAGMQHSFDVNAAARRLANQMQYGSRTSTAAWGAQLAPVADPNVKLSGFHHGFQDTIQICIGMIVDAVSITHTYRVQVEKLGATIPAGATINTSQSIFGATQLNTYVPGTYVLVAIHPKIPYGYILGCIPETNYNGRDAMHDYITQTSRKRVDDAHKKYIKMLQSTGMPDFSNWKPWDSTASSEWGAVSSTGLKVTLDDFMVQAAVNEFCGLFGFYHDMLLRIAGYNLQTWTAGHERDAYMDQAEYNDYQGYTPYPWEQMGVFDPKEVIQEYFPPNYQCPNEQPFFAHWENKKDCQQPFHRTHDFFGYLGQGQRRIVQSPPVSKPPFWSYEPGSTNGPGSVYESPVQTDGDLGRDCSSGPPKTEDYKEKPPVQTHEDNVALDGRRFIASAKGILIAKRMALPSIMRKKRPEAGDGDDAERNYKAGSKYGAGPDHPITGDIETTAKYPHLQRAAGILDLHAYFYNYSGLHAFHWHEKDYKTWEQTKLEPFRYNHRLPTFNSLVGEMFLPHPVPIIMPIDHRYDKKPQKFYETESFISLLEDGTVIIGDGYGAEIRMTAGSMFLASAGDVWMKPGRNAHIWAGRDIIQRAVKNIDMSSTERSIRVKAERNVLIFAGNKTSDREGGVLIESRANYAVYDFEKCGEDIMFGGVVLRAPSAEVVGMARRIYMRTAGSDVFTDSAPGAAGPITLDAGRGTAEIVTKSNNIYQFVGEGGAIYQFFRNQADDDTVQSNYFSKDFTLLTGPLGCDGTMLVDGIDNGASFVARGHIISSEGHIITEEAARGSLFVWPCDGKCQKQVNKAVEQTRKYIEEVLPEAGEKIDDEYLKQLWYAPKRPGNNRVMDIMEFTFRTTPQYTTQNFEMWEDRWQQMARFCSATDVWVERPVPAKVCIESWPFPGKEKFDEPIFMVQDLRRVNQGCNLIDKDRLSNTGGNLAEEYRDPRFADPNPQPLNTYPIVGGGY